MAKWDAWRTFEYELILYQSNNELLKLFPYIYSKKYHLLQ